MWRFLLHRGRFGYPESDPESGSSLIRRWRRWRGRRVQGDPGPSPVVSSVQSVQSVDETGSPRFSLKAAVGLSTDFTDFTDGLEPGASTRRRFHFTRRVKPQPLSTGFQSVESVQSVDPTAFSRIRDVSRSRQQMPNHAAWGHAAYRLCNR